MDNRAKIDPIAYGFFKNESLELGERIADALLEAAKNLEISFNQHIMPTVSCITKAGTVLNFSNSIDYTDYDAATQTDANCDLLQQAIAASPDCEEFLKASREKLKLLNHKAYEYHDIYTEKQLVLSEAGAMWGGTFGGHANPDFGRIINLGTDGIRKILESGKRQNTVDTDWFYRACEKTLDAIDILGDRFREIAISESKKCQDKADKYRFDRAAEAFKTVPRKPAYDFNSACLVFWMIFSFDGIDSPGRFDQYMYRCYSVANNKEEVADLLCRLWECFHETRTWNLCLAGSDESWNDQSNELTYDILKLAAEKRYETPNITLRVHRNTPERLWAQIAETLGSGIGMPALYNDEAVCPALERMGIPPVDSHLYCMNGCNQIDIMGKSHMGLEDGEVFLAKCLEYTLHNGINALNGNLESIQTGNPEDFESYEALEQAFFRQLEYITVNACGMANSAQLYRAKYKPNPLRSCLVEGCLEKGIDFRNGGPRYNHGQILAEGIADTGDSLYAVKKLVYDQKKYTMKQLITALKADFVSYEDLRIDFARCEKFGNDHAEVDQITTRIVNRFLTVLRRINTYRGGRYSGGCSPFYRTASYGRRLAALPNGRRNGDELIADCIGAVPGENSNGPTALLNSVLGYDHKNAGSGFIMQIKFDKKLFDTEHGKKVFIALAKTYFNEGGQQLTTTVVNPHDLIDALENPQKHKDLIVRVGGYSAKFIDLERGVQDNIIKRTYIT